MYAICVNDICNAANSDDKCVPYANDTVIIVSARSVETLFELFKYYFTLFSNWFVTNKLSLNDGITCFIIFALNISLTNYELITFYDRRVHCVTEVQYLGVHVFIDEF